MSARIDDSLLQAAKRASCIELAQRFTELKRCTPREYEGACPLCKDGRDRFHCTAEWWFCRKCHPERADVISLHMALTRLDFAASVAALGGGVAPVAAQPKVQPAATDRTQDDAWRTRAKELMQEAVYRLWNTDEGNSLGLDYLRGRGFALDTIGAYELGFWHANIPGSKDKAPSVCIPWVDSQGRVVAIKYRFITAQQVNGKPLRYTSRGGSDWSGAFGAHLLGDTAANKAESTLIITEGELNCAAVHQVLGFTWCSVISLGSDTNGTQLDDRRRFWLSGFANVIIWYDKPEKAGKLAAQLRNALAIAPAQDAADMLRDGTLGAFVAACRVKACNGDAGKLAKLRARYQQGSADAGALDVVYGI